MSFWFKIDGFYIPEAYDINIDKKLSTNEINIFCSDHDLKYDEETQKITSAPDEIIDLEEYSIESLRKRYPEDKYEVFDDDEAIFISDKSTGKLILMICGIGSTIGITITMFNENKEPVYIRNYDRNGNLYEYSEKDGKTHNIIADNIYNAVSAKKCKVIPTTDVNKLALNIKRITSENIKEIMDYYEQEYGKNLIEAIKNEYGLKDSIKNKLIEHLNKCAVENLEVNCKIDKDFQQGQIGDCWLLASIAAIKRSPKGQEILNNMITDNKDGSYTVKFRGSDKEYRVSACELLEKDYAKGDLDVRILEVAAEKHFGEIDGDTIARAMELLLGTESSCFRGMEDYFSETIIAEIKHILKNPNIIMTIDTNLKEKNVKEIRENSNESDYKKEIFGTHAYAVVGIDDEYIYLQNPHDTSKDIKVPLNMIGEYWSNLNYIEIK